MVNLPNMQAQLKEMRLDGWLLYDFRGSNVLAERVLGIAPDKVGSRRYAYFVPASGAPRKLVHRIEMGALDHLPGDKTVYLRWQEFEAGMKTLVGSAKRIAMEYSPKNGIPYLSRVDAGTVELLRSFGVEPIGSGDLIQQFEACWDEEMWKLHLEACKHTESAYALAWRFVAEAVRARRVLKEKQVADVIMEHFKRTGMTTYSPPIVGVNAGSGDPHHESSDAEIHEGDFVLIDLWAKMDHPNGVYSDLTWVGFLGTSVPAKYEQIFQIVARSRDAAISFVKGAFAAKKPIQGWQVDDAARKVIDDAGYGPAFCHRTGHNIGRETHGNGANMDNLETHDERQVLPRTCFSVEPGIYLPEFGVRSETNVFIDKDGGVHVTGPKLQTAVLPVLAQF